MIDLTDYPCQKPRVLVQQVSDTTVLLNVDTGNYYALNKVGARIWELCDDKHTISEIVTVITQEYIAPPETIAADVLELLADLKNEKLLVHNA